MPAELDPQIIATRMLIEGIGALLVDAQGHTVGQIAWAGIVRLERIAIALETCANVLDPERKHRPPPPPGATTPPASQN